MYLTMYSKSLFYQYVCSLNIPWHPISNYFLHIRNNFFLYLHLLLEVVVYGEFSYEVFGFCLDMGTSSISLCIPYILLALKSYLFYLCCSRDPGKQIRPCLIFMNKKNLIHSVWLFFWRHTDKGKPYFTTEDLPVWWKTVPAGSPMFNLSAGQTCPI